MHQILGLDEDAEALYRLLLTEGPSHVDSLSRNLADAAQQLRADGLIYGEGLLTAARPELALKRRLVEGQRAMAAAEARMAELEMLYEANSHLHRGQAAVDVLTDLDHVRKTFGHIEQTARRELLSFATAPFRVVTGEQDLPDQDHPRCRILMEEEVFADKEAVDAAERAHQWGCEIRVIDRLPFKLIIGDRDRALVPQHADRDLPVLLVHPSTVMDALLATFELFWERALPRRTAWRNNGTDQERPTEQEITIVRHLARGATEQQIATALGISKRTVIRRIQQLMDRAEVSTRFQLGLHAARVGWLSKVVDG
ncbi:helix-turn-helix transcriptional regulator [Nonomuraea maritima]|uniref:helix-turn-helix transcriptional regulator n=1 Tax=Nonomuraea maritima TaxID=683260 RepID=UPI0037219F78